MAPEGPQSCRTTVGGSIDEAQIRDPGIARIPPCPCRRQRWRSFRRRSAHGTCRRRDDRDAASHAASGCGESRHAARGTESEAWLSRQDGAELSLGLGKDMREVCEALVEAECSWKEYAFMISGNVLVASRGESGRRIVEGWNTLLKETRGIASIDFVAPNQAKLQRVNEVFENWRARLCGQTVNIRPDGQSGTQRIGDELFQDVWEDREEWRAPYQ